MLAVKATQKRPMTEEEMYNMTVAKITSERARLERTVADEEVDHATSPIHTKMSDYVERKLAEDEQK